MEKNVLLTVLGVQNNIGNSNMDRMEFVTKGNYYEKGEKIYITYKETELIGDEDTTATIKIEKDKVTLSRIGENNTHMIFEKGQKHFTHYTTPFGSFNLGITTKNIDVSIDEEFGQIKIEYLLEVNNAAIGINNIHVKILSGKKES